MPGGSCCQPKTPANTCVSQGGLLCGPIDNGCGGTLDCGGCLLMGELCDPQTHQCQCAPVLCDGVSCGEVTNGCATQFCQCDGGLECCDNKGKQGGVCIPKGALCQ